MKSLSSLVASLALIAGCSSTPAPQATPTDSAPTKKADVVQPTSTASRPNISELDDPNSPLAQRSIYFPYDVYAVDHKYDDTLKAHSHYLEGHGTTRVSIEGNADERGSHEYNLALGQKRAEAVKRILVLDGAREDQLEAVSYGAERPRKNCHDESCWQENRRADLAYRAPKN